MITIFLATVAQTDVTNNNFVKLMPLTDPVDLELEGLVVDVTVSKIGRDFYESFYSKWEPDESLPKLPIVISERSLPTRGFEVIVTIDDNIIFQNFVQPNYDAIEESAMIAVGTALNYLQNYENLLKQFENEDLSGSGIY